jgi:hypothetical protein
MAVIAIDFDHTLVELDKPLEGAREAVNIFRELGHKVIIHSCNSERWIKQVLGNNDIRYDKICGENTPKPIADIYIDDKGYRFGGNWAYTSRDVVALLMGFDNRKW